MERIRKGGEMSLDIQPRMVAIIYVLASITVLINIYYADAKSILCASAVAYYRVNQVCLCRHLDQPLSRIWFR